MRGENVICFSTLDWDFLWARKQYLASLLAEAGNRVLYINPPYDLVTKLRHPESHIDRSLKSRFEWKAERLGVLTLPYMVPQPRNNAFSLGVNLRLLIHVIRKYQRSLEMNDPVLWLWDWRFPELIGAFGEKLSVFDMVDFHSKSNSFRRLVAREHEVIERVDVVFATAHEIVEYVRRMGREATYLPNGVDFAAASRVSKRLPVPSDIARLTKPVLGFVGGIGSWIDVDLLIEVARSHPDKSVALVGPVGRENIRSLDEAPSNLHLLGSKSHDEIPAYLRAFDLCLSAFKTDEFCRSVNPLKVYEYLAAGKPVITTPMPELADFKSVLHIAESRDAYVGLIDKALAGDSPESRAERMAAVKARDWSRLFETVQRTLDRKLSRAVSRETVA